VDAKVGEKFADMLARAVSALPVGSGLDANVKVGPVINEPARKTMLGLVEEAVGHGARVLTGGKVTDRPGYFVPPTVLSQVRPDEHILKEEIFGPIAPIVTFETVDQAIDFANKTDRGLASYVYTRELATGLRVAEAIESGMGGPQPGLHLRPCGAVRRRRAERALAAKARTRDCWSSSETKYIATAW